ncbi:MarR family winged helix-turn-helix transcriptional regulator [Candidatus Omnitrophota bacterium]
MASIDREAKEFSALHARMITGLKGSFLPSEDVTPQQMITILTISELKSCKVSIISKRMGISPPVVTGLVDRLVSNGYVARARDSKDRRTVFVKLTKKGDTYVGKFRRAIQKKWKQILVHLTEEERSAYIKIMKKLMRAIEREKAKNA